MYKLVTIQIFTDGVLIETFTIHLDLLTDLEVLSDYISECRKFQNLACVDDGQIGVHCGKISPVLVLRKLV